MAGPTVIDSLIVRLGLDPSGFKKGTDQAVKSTKATQDTIKVSAEAMAKSIEQVGRSVAALFLGFESVTGLGKFLANLNKTNANLANVSANLGLSVHELDAWDKAVELVGGTVEEAQGSLKGLSQELVQYSRGLGRGPLLTFLQNQGIATEDANGKIRSTVDLYKDLARTLDGVDRQTANAALRQAGFTENVATLLVLERSERERILALGEKNAAVTAAGAEEARKLQIVWANLQQQVAAVGQGILAAVTDMSKAFGGFESITYGAVLAMKAVGAVTLTVLNAVLQIRDGMGATMAIIGAIAHGNFKEAFAIYKDRLSQNAQQSGSLGGSLYELFNGAYAPGISKGVAPTPGAVRNNNPGNIKAVGNQPRDSRGFRIFANPAEGVAAIGHQLDLFAGRGINTISGIVNKYAPASDNNDVPAYIRALEQATGRKGTEELTAADRAALIRGIIEHEGVIRGDRISSLLGPNPNALGLGRGVGPTPGADRGSAGTTSTTTVTVGDVTINTAATDANGIARDFGAALNRKGILTQADTGMTS